MVLGADRNQSGRFRRMRDVGVARARLTGFSILGKVASQVGGLAHGRRIGVRGTRYFLHGNVRCNARNRINSMGSSSRHEPLVGTPSLI